MTAACGPGPLPGSPKSFVRRALWKVLFRRARLFAPALEIVYSENIPLPAPRGANVPPAAQRALIRNAASGKRRPQRRSHGRRALPLRRQQNGKIRPGRKLRAAPGASPPCGQLVPLHRKERFHDPL